jgi:hypothetical protein
MAEAGYSQSGPVADLVVGAIVAAVAGVIATPTLSAVLAAIAAIAP